MILGSSSEATVERSFQEVVEGRMDAQRASIVATLPPVAEVDEPTHGEPRSARSPSAELGLFIPSLSNTSITDLAIRFRKYVSMLMPLRQPHQYRNLVISWMSTSIHVFNAVVCPPISSTGPGHREPKETDICEEVITTIFLQNVRRHVK
jgi:hypothetical protein